MSDFNKGDLPPERERKRIYATLLYSLIKDGRYKPETLNWRVQLTSMQWLATTWIR